MKSRAVRRRVFSQPNVFGSAMGLLLVLGGPLRRNWCPALLVDTVWSASLQCPGDGAIESIGKCLLFP